MLPCYGPRADSFRDAAYDGRVLNRVHRLQVDTRGKGLYEITDSVERWLAQQGARDRVC